MRRAALLATTELILQAADLPRDLRIVGIRLREDGANVEVFLEGDSLPEKFEFTPGEMVGTITPIYETVAGCLGMRLTRFVEWA